MFDPQSSSASLSTSASSIKEGSSLTTTVNTKNVDPDTTLFWTLTGSGIDSNDLDSGELSGFGTVSKSGSFSFSHLFSEDLTTEGTEKILISLFSDQSLKNLVADTSLSILDSSTTPEARTTAKFDPTPKTLTEGDVLTLTGASKNLEPGATLYWNLSSQSSEATLKDFNIIGSNARKRSTTIAKDGSFTFSIQSLQDKTKESNEQFQVELFTTPLSKKAIALTEPITLIDATNKEDAKEQSEARSELKLESQVFPARLAGKRIPIQQLIDFSNQNKQAKFTLDNSEVGGYFEYQNKVYQGEEIRNISTQDLKKVYYVPKAPAGNSNPKKLKTIKIETSTETLTQKDGLQSKTNGNSELTLQESKEKIKQRQDPFNPQTTLNKRSNAGITDGISVSINPPNSRTTIEHAEWITRSNWTPEIILLQNTFKAAPKKETGIAIGNIIDIYDLDGDKISNIQIKDISDGAQTGFFTYNKEDYQGTALPPLSEADLRNVTYHPGVSGTNVIEVSARDSLGSSSRTFEAKLNTKKPEQVSLNSIKQTFDTADLGQPIPLSNLISITTGDALDSNSYNIDLKSKRNEHDPLGYFELNGKRLQQQQLTDLSQDQLGKIDFVPTISKLKSTFTLKASDRFGRTTTSSSAWKTTANQKPKVNVEPMRLPANKANQPISISNLISAEDDGDAVASYTLKSSKGQGSFRFKGKTYSNQALTVGAGDLSRVTYVPPASGKSDRVRITASDGENESNPSFVNWSTGGRTQLGSITRSFNVSIDKEWSIGNFLGVRNDYTYSKFFGLDRTISNVNLNRSMGVAGVKFRTGNTRMKAGLQIDAGYGLGSLTLQGGLSARATLDENGLSFEGTSSNPTLDLELPYAYLGLDAVGKFKFAPSLKFWYDLWLADGETSNLLRFLNTDVDISRSLVDLDTRHMTGNNYTRSFNIGALSANASIPRFGRVSELNRIPPAIQTSNGWGDGFGDGVAYGISGSTTLVDLDLSLGQVASYFGLPLSIRKSIWGGDLRITGTLADASIGIDATLNYDARVAVKPNVFATVEGSNPNRKYDILGGVSTIDTNNFSDTNNDGNISVTIEADPIIAANASVSVEGSVDAGAEVLSARARLNKWGYNKTWNVGPLWQGGPWDLYSNERSLINMTKSYSLSNLAPNVQDQLSMTIDLPIT